VHGDMVRRGGGEPSGPLRLSVVSSAPSVASVESISRWASNACVVYLRPPVWNRVSHWPPVWNRGSHWPPGWTITHQGRNAHPCATPPAGNQTQTHDCCAVMRVEPLQRQAPSLPKQTQRSAGRQAGSRPNCTSSKTPQQRHVPLNAPATSYSLAHQPGGAVALVKFERPDVQHQPLRRHGQTSPLSLNISGDALDGSLDRTLVFHKVCCRDLQG